MHIEKYYKVHLLAFGDTTPRFIRDSLLFDYIKEYISIIPSNTLAHGKVDQPPFNINGTIIKPVICYEALFSNQLEANKIDLYLFLGEMVWFRNSGLWHILKTVLAYNSIKTNKIWLIVNNNSESGIMDKNYGFIETKNITYS